MSITPASPTYTNHKSIGRFFEDSLNPLGHENVMGVRRFSENANCCKLLHHQHQALSMSLDGVALFA